MPARITTIALCLLAGALLSGCVAKPHRYCHSGLVEQDGGYFYERDGGYFYERDGGYFHERDGGYFHERDGGYIWERDNVSYPIVCRSGVRCEDSDGTVRCEDI